MVIYRIFGVIGICLGLAFSCFAQESVMPFIPAVFWSDQAEKGVILSSPNEMTTVDVKGTKYPKITSSEPVANASLSPDGKKIIYSTAAGLWIVSLDSQISTKVYTGMCDVPRWSKDGAGFTFAAYEKKAGGNGEFIVKLFWADSDGKNLKQVYP